MHRRRYVLVLLWLGLISWQAFHATRLEPTSSAPSLFDRDHNMVRRVFILQNAFGEEATGLLEAASAAARLSESGAVADWIQSPGGQACLASCHIADLADGRCH